MEVSQVDIETSRNESKSLNSEPSFSKALDLARIQKIGGSKRTLSSPTPENRGKIDLILRKTFG